MDGEERWEDMAVEELNVIDKLEVNFTLRIPEVTKRQLERLPATMKKKLNNRILLTMAVYSTMRIMIRESILNQNRHLVEKLNASIAKQCL
jgi:hypothetical protein